jgi:thiol-disulfide isomerase/thioredoxin
MLKRAFPAIVLVALTFTYAQTPAIDQVKAATARGDFAGSDLVVQTLRKQVGTKPELALAVSWQARGALAAKNLDLAESYADQARDLSLQILKNRKLDAEPWLPLALGASIEVHAQVMAARGETSGAVGFLQDERRRYAGTSIVERIGKNINLLSLEGKPAPTLNAAEWIGTKPPELASLRGKPVLLFFWAHWCPDCKAEVPILTNLMRRYGPSGLTIVAPTRYYGYVEGGEDAKPAEEKRYIEQIRNRYYPLLASAPVPLSKAVFEAYGCSSTPTLALVDKAGIVRWYHPGAATEAELAAQVERILK